MLCVTAKIDRPCRWSGRAPARHRICPAAAKTDAIATDGTTPYRGRGLSWSLPGRASSAPASTARPAASKQVPVSILCHPFDPGEVASPRPAAPDQVRGPGRCPARSSRPRTSRHLPHPHRACASGYGWLCCASVFTRARDSNRPDFEVAAIELEDDAVVVVGLRVDNFAQIESHAL